MVSSTPRPHFTPGKEQVPILQETGWAPGLVWMGGKSHPHRDSILDCPARSQSLHRLSYLAHTHITHLCVCLYMYICVCVCVYMYIYTHTHTLTSSKYNKFNILSMNYNIHSTNSLLSTSSQTSVHVQYLPKVMQPCL